MSSAKNPAPRDLGERTLSFSCEVVRLCEALENRGGVARRIGWQLLDAATSVGANYQESQAASSRRDFLLKQQIALREAYESRYWLRMLGACGLTAAGLEPLLTEANELIAILTASTRTAKIALGRLPPR